jgi:hypothetical protein
LNCKSCFESQICISIDEIEPAYLDDEVYERAFEIDEIEPSYSDDEVYERTTEEIPNSNDDVESLHSAGKTNST